MAITISKTLPTSSWYSGSGATTITLAGINTIVVNTKKELTKIQIPKSPSNVSNTGSDMGSNFVKDLKRIEDNIKLNGWLADTTGSSAWSQAWKLRAMTAVGGPITSLVIEDHTFGTGSQQAYLEEVNFVAHPDRPQNLTIQNTSSASVGTARIEVELSFYLGDSR